MGKFLPVVMLLPLAISAPAQELSPSDIGITDIPTGADFVPLGPVFELAGEGSLRYIPGHDWVQSCFILVAVGKTDDGKPFLFQGRLPFTGEGAFAPKVFLGGRWHVLPTFRGPLYYEASGPITTVYEFDTARRFRQSLAYDEGERTWTYRIEPLPGNTGLRFLLKGKALGTPFWMGKFSGPYIIHGVYTGCEAFDTWAGFWDIGTFEAEVSAPGRGTIVARGHFLFNRATHRAYPQGACRRRGHVVSFSCLYLFQEGLSIALSHSENPSPLEPPVPFQHQARINFPYEGKSFPLTGFRFGDDGGLQPAAFHLEGEFAEGSLELDGEVLLFYPGRWGVSVGAWWAPEGKHVWGRAVIRWRGKVIWNGREIPLDATGWGEFTRFRGSPGCGCG
ncbi:hypothetical protein ACVNPS_02700 [Candidatus Bipolaricaulota sp. J31]